MKKISEQTKKFLLYGIESTIKPKEIYKLDGVILFLDIRNTKSDLFNFILLGRDDFHADDHGKRKL